MITPVACARKIGAYDAPGLGRGLVEHAAHREEELGRLAHDLDDRIDGEPEAEDDDRADAQLHRQRRRAEPPQQAPARRAPRPRARGAEAPPAGTAGGGGRAGELTVHAAPALERRPRGPEQARM